MLIANDILIPELARLLAEGKEVRFTPSGVSMRPFIEGGKDSVVLEQVKDTPRVGDIILAQVSVCSEHKTYVLHRLVRIENGTYILQGDGNLTGEEHCGRDGIIGRVKRIETPSGRMKPNPRGRLWFRLRPARKWLLKIYRHSVLKWHYT